MEEAKRNPELLKQAVSELKADKNKEEEDPRDKHVKECVKNYVSYMRSSRKDYKRAQQEASRIGLTDEDKKELDKLI